jgi:hypothetical protein
MSDGVFISKRPQLAIARQTVSFASLGLNDPTLTRIIYEVGNPYLSYIPTEEFNPISGITEGKSYRLYLNAFFDGSPALANAVLTNLIPQTTTNVFADERVVFLCTSSVSFATAGITTGNTRLITLVSEGYFTSYDPNDTINGIDGFVEGELYDIDPITDIDLHLYGVTEIRYSDEVLYLDSLEDVVITNTNPSATLPLSEEEVLVRNITTGVWENKPVSDLPSGSSYTDADARAAISLTTTGTSGAATYNSTTGALNVPVYADTNTNIYNTDGTLAANRTITGNNKTLALTGGRWEEAKGADVASANNLTLGSDGNTFNITGTTQINAITIANWQAGSHIYLIFASTPTVKHNTAGGAGTAVLLLSGAVDYVAAANDVLSLVYDGTSWHEKGRKIAATGGSTPGIDSVLAIGQNLTANRTINTTSAFSLAISGAVPSATAAATLQITNTSTTGAGIVSTTNNSSGTAIAGNNTTGTAVYGNGNTGVNGNTTSGIGINAAATTGTGLTASATTGVPAQITANPATSNTVVDVVRVERNNSGGAGANGIGGAINFRNETASNFNTQTSNRIVSKWTDATTASRTSQMIIEGVNNATTVNLLTLGSQGYMQLLPIAATAASAITASAGMIVYVNATDATFTSVGFWGYDGTTWNKF